MNTQISTKLAALAVALMINGTMIGTIAYLFDGPFHGRIASTAAVQAPVSPVSARAV